MLTEDQFEKLWDIVLHLERKSPHKQCADELRDFIIAASAAPAERRETADEKFNPYVEPEATTNQTLTEAIEWCIAHGNCGPRTRATLIAARSALATAPTMPHEGREPTGDELRKLVREIRDASGGPSDAPQPDDYVLGGWRAALATTPTKPVEERDDWLDDIRRAIRVYACACSGDKSSIPNASREVERLLALATAPTMSEAARDVLAERRRQVEVEGFTPEHDDEHDACEMADAAAAYALYYSGWAEGGRPVEVWPADWSHKWWKPTTPRRDLVKAGALILAEIERIDRAAAKGGSK